MGSNTQFLTVAPVIPSSNISRDIVWYQEKAGFAPTFYDEVYAGIQRDGVFIHLQWHANTEDDPLLGGSVVKVFVKNIEPIFNEFLEKGIVNQDALKLNTGWNTNEFGFFDLNNNAIFFVEDINSLNSSAY